MPYQSYGKTYCRLIIVATDPQTEIWIGCDHGHFVAKETGKLETGLLPQGETFSTGSVCGNWQLSVDDVFQIK